MGPNQSRINHAPSFHNCRMLGNFGHHQRKIITRRRGLTNVRKCGRQNHPHQNHAQPNYCPAVNKTCNTCFKCRHFVQIVFIFFCCLAFSTYIPFYLWFGIGKCPILFNTVRLKPNNCNPWVSIQTTFHLHFETKFVP